MTDDVVMSRFGGLPDRRRGIRGTDAHGAAVWLSFSISKKLYRCPGCRRELAIGAEHALVRIVPGAGDSYHQHWHMACAHELLLRELTDLEAVAADARGSGARPSLSKGNRRRVALERRTRRGR